MNPELLNALAKALGITNGEAVKAEAVLAGLREEGLLKGSRSFWTMHPARLLADNEIKALVWAAFGASILRELSAEEVPW